MSLLICESSLQLSLSRFIINSYRSTAEYKADYNNNPPNTVSFMTAMASTESGRLHSEFVRLLFLQTHRETDLFFAGSGVQLAQPNSGFFHFRRAAFSS
jgi:hypothetical protein